MVADVVGYSRLAVRLPTATARHDPHIHHADRAFKAALQVGIVAFEANLNDNGGRKIRLEPCVVSKLCYLRGPARATAM